VKIVLHILRKDFFRHRWELALFVLSCAAWACQVANPFGWVWLREREFVSVLFFGLWFFLIVRVIQGESLVGDREFWMTRPYRWGGLLFAKMLFVILCVNLPFLIAQILLLAHAGIPISGHLIPGLIFLQLEFTFFLSFPVAVLATITESLVQWGLAVAGLFVFSLMLSWLPWSKLPPPLERGENICSILAMAIIAPAFICVVLWQYARRRVWPARLVFAGAVLVVPLVILLASTPLIRLIAYPPSNSKSYLQLSMAEDTQSHERNYLRSGDEGNISLPVEAKLTDSDLILDVDGLRVFLAGDNGWSWHTPWLNNSIGFSKDSPNATIEFAMPADLADQMKHLHPKATVELAFGVYRLGPPHVFATTGERFGLSAGIICRWAERVPGYAFLRGSGCVAPLSLPEATEIRIDSGSNTCDQSGKNEPPLPAGHSARHVEYGSGMPADFDPDPVRKISLDFGDWTPPIPSVQDPKTNLHAFPCKGWPFSVRMGFDEGKMRAEFNLGEIGNEKDVVEDPHPLPFSIRAD